MLQDGHGRTARSLAGVRVDRLFLMSGLVMWTLDVSEFGIAVRLRKQRLLLLGSCSSLSFPLSCS